MPVFTIRTLAAESDEILSEYPYWIWYPAEQTLTVSKSTFKKTKANESNGIIFRAPGADADIETTTFYYYYITPIEPDVTVVLRYYTNLGIWQAEMPWELETDDGWIECPIGYQHQYSTSTLAVQIYTNGHTIATGSGSGITNSWSINGSLPSDMPDVTIGMGDINATINDTLNATTSATTQAGTIQSTVNTKLDQYEQGQITSNQMQSVIDTANTQLDDLASQSGNTLSDQIAINNAQNAVQIAQDKVLSQDLINSINNLFKVSFIDPIPIATLAEEFKTIYIDNYINGIYTKEDVLVNGLPGGSMPSLLAIKAQLQDAFIAECKTQADFEYLNQMMSTVDNCIDIINSAGDVDKEIAESASNSMESEKEYVESLLSETNQSLSDLTPELNDFDSIMALEYVGMIWDNEFFKRVLPWCGIMMLICLVLGVKYKG